MLDDQELKAGANEAIWHFRPLDPVTSPCACCSSAFGTLNSLMHVTDTELSDPAWWRVRGRPLPEVSAHPRVFINARILTMDADNPTVDAIAIKGDRIVAVGAAAKEMSEPGLEVIDCKDGFMLPGFIEPHMHLLPIASIGRFEDVGPFRFETIEDALGQLRKVAAATPPGEWVMGRQFDPSLQEGPDTLTREMLDTVSTAHPVFVYNTSLHFAYCNSMALAVAGITADTPDDPNSPYGRDESGAPNGVLQGGHAMASVARHNSAMRSYDLAESCLDVCERANRVGITTFCDQATGMSRGTSEVDLYRAIAASGQMTARLRYSLAYGLSDQWDATGIKRGDGDELVRATAWKIVSDGSNQGFSGLQREPYLYSDHRGLAYVEPERLKEMVLDRAQRGWPLAIHANGDQAIDNTLDAFEAAFDKGLLTQGPNRIEHCSILHDEQIARIRKMGLSPSFLIGHVYYWGQAMRDKVFGDYKASLLDRTAACEAQGIRWTLHSDEPVTEMNPLRCIENAVSRKMWKEPATILAPEEKITVDAALRSMTIDAAWQCHSDHEIGSIEVGKFADFVVLDQDPRQVPVDKISEIGIRETWMGGRKVYER